MDPGNGNIYPMDNRGGDPRASTGGLRWFSGVLAVAILIILLFEWGAFG